MKLKLRKPSWTEKRDSIRLELECPVVYRVMQSKWGLFKKAGPPVSALMTKPSLHGLRLCSKTKSPVGTEMEIEVDMPKLGFDRKYLVLGKVMWAEFSGKTKCNEHGIRLDSNGADYRKWEKFVLGQLQSTDRRTK